MYLPILPINFQIFAAGSLQLAASRVLLLRHWELALEVFGSLARRDVISYSAVISCCEKAGILAVEPSGKPISDS